MASVEANGLQRGAAGGGGSKSRRGGSGSGCGGENDLVADGAGAAASEKVKGGGKGKATGVDKKEGEGEEGGTGGGGGGGGGRGGEGDTPPPKKKKKYIRNPETHKVYRARMEAELAQARVSEEVTSVEKPAVRRGAAASAAARAVAAVGGDVAYDMSVLCAIPNRANAIISRLDGVHLIGCFFTRRFCLVIEFLLNIDLQLGY